MHCRDTRNGTTRTCSFLLAAFTELRKASIRFIMSPVRPSVCPFVRMKQNGSIGRIFMEFDVSLFFENLSRKFKFHENPVKITGALFEYLCTLMLIPH